MRSLLAVAVLVFYAQISAASAQSLKIGYSPDWAPYSIVKDNTTVGILPALLDEIITRNLDIPLEHVGLPWKRVQSMVKAGSLDALITFPSEARLEYAERSSNVVYNLEYRAFVHKGSAAAKALTAAPGVDALKGHTGCIIFGNDWAKNFYAKHAIPFQSAVDVKNCFRLLERDRVDFLIQATAVGMGTIREMEMENAIAALPQIYTGVPFTLLISKKSQFHKTFLPKFDAVIDKMNADGSLDALIMTLQNDPPS